MTVRHTCVCSFNQAPDHLCFVFFCCYQSVVIIELSRERKPM